MCNFMTALFVAASGTVFIPDWVGKFVLMRLGDDSVGDTQAKPRPRITKSCLAS
jgi:hypothetical protein